MESLWEAVKPGVGIIILVIVLSGLGVIFKWDWLDKDPLDQLTQIEKDVKELKNNK